MAYESGRGPIPHLNSVYNNIDPTSGFTSGKSVKLDRYTADGRWIPDVIEGQALYLGVDRSRDTTDPRAFEKRVNKVFPDSFGPDASIYVEELLILNIVTTQERLLDWCPIMKNPHGLAVKLRKTIFHHAMPDPIPEQGVARVVTQSYEQWEAFSARIGLAFQMEDGFKMTPQGRGRDCVRERVCNPLLYFLLEQNTFCDVRMLIFGTSRTFFHSPVSPPAQVNATTSATWPSSPMPLSPMVSSTSS